MTEELDVLEKIHKNSQIKQREISDSTGMSLGMVNLIIKKLVQKGWLTAKRINSRNIKYLVTPSGLDMLSRKSVNYLKTTLKTVKEYQNRIDKMVEKIVAEGYHAVNLVGDSSVDFMVENSCRKYGISFTQNSKIEDESIIFVSENYVRVLEKGLLLKEILMGDGNHV